MLTCRELFAFLSDYVDGELEEDQRKEFEQHVDECPPCVEFLRSFRMAIEMGREACQCADDNPPQEVPKGIIKAVLAARALK